MVRTPLPLLVLAALLAGCNTEKTVPLPPAAPAKVIRDGSLMEPGRPQLASFPLTAAPGVHTVSWNMWWGENGHRWFMYVNGRVVESGELEVDSPRLQQGSVDLALETPGRYEIKVALCNDHGCSESEPVLVQVAAG